MDSSVLTTGRAHRFSDANRRSNAASVVLSDAAMRCLSQRYRPSMPGASSCTAPVVSAALSASAINHYVYLVLPSVRYTLCSRACVIIKCASSILATACLAHTPLSRYDDYESSRKYFPSPVASSSETQNNQRSRRPSHNAACTLAACNASDEASSPANPDATSTLVCVAGVNQSGSSSGCDPHSTARPCPT